MGTQLISDSTAYMANYTTGIEPLHVRWHIHRYIGEIIVLFCTVITVDLTACHTPCHAAYPYCLAALLVRHLVVVSSPRLECGIFPTGY
jgi:hypothetical protein